MVDRRPLWPVPCARTPWRTRLRSIRPAHCGRTRWLSVVVGCLRRNGAAFRVAPRNTCRQKDREITRRRPRTRDDAQRQGERGPRRLSDPARRFDLRFTRKLRIEARPGSDGPWPAPGVPAPLRSSEWIYGIARERPAPNALQTASCSPTSGFAAVGGRGHDLCRWVRAAPRSGEEPAGALARRGDSSSPRQAAPENSGWRARPTRPPRPSRAARCSIERSPRLESIGQLNAGNS